VATGKDRLFHLLPEAALPSFEAGGLLSAEALCDRYGIAEPRRTALLEQDRGKGNFERLSAPGLPDACLRDQVLPDPLLKRCLTGSYNERPAAWRRLLNGFVFFWAAKKRAKGLRDASTARRQVLLVFDRGILEGLYGNRMMTSPINTGAPFGGNPSPRGDGTFLPLLPRPRPDGRKVVEVVIPYAAPRAREALIDIERCASD